jgi:hypothetical protein
MIHFNLLTYMWKIHVGIPVVIYLRHCISLVPREERMYYIVQNRGGQPRVYYDKVQRENTCTYIVECKPVPG